MSNPKYLAIAYIVLAVVLVGVARSAQDIALEYIKNEAMESIDVSAIEIPENASRDVIISTYADALKKKVNPEPTYKSWIVVLIKYIMQMLAIYFCASMLVRKLKHVPSHT